MNEWLCQVTLENSASNKTVVDIFLFDQCSILTQTNLNITQLSSLFLSVLSVFECVLCKRTDYYNFNMANKEGR